MGYEVDDTFDLVQDTPEEHIDWSVYSEHYDNLCSANPAYLENIEDLVSRISSWELPANASVCDVGAGTGSFTIALASEIPNANLHHLDFDPAMTAIARKKYAEVGLNVSIHENDVRTINLPNSTFDLLICVNTIYSIPEHDVVLKKIRDWTKPNGRLYIIDFGRKVALLDWAVYILRDRVRKLGIRDTIRWYLDNSQNLKQNRKGANAQAAGSYWLHSTEEFRASLENAGWFVDEIKTCYRDCCDLAVCSNPANPP